MNYFYAQPFKLDNGKDDSQFWIDVALADPKELNDNYAFVQFDVEPLGIVKGNIDVVLTELASGADYITVGIKTACDQVDLFDLYAADLDTASAWSVTKAGVAVTPSAVAQDTALKGIKISLTTPTGAHVIDLVSCAALAALSVGGSPENGFESTGSLSKTF